MRIAVATRDFRTVCGHAGRARRWMVFDAEPDADPVVAALVELDPGQVFHHAAEDSPHPLDGVAALIAASCGDGFSRKTRRRGIVAAMTREADPARAVAGYLNDCLPPPRPRPVLGLICKIRDRLHA